ncbi:uncharacterized protein A4U43_C04F8380 [Asparagus officinalis]|uniref:Uncharacterized protein n=1 Tax=Asparagus officinalis TaxID=4686 RepID=A0A5P1F446_ASPOF|nr:uncharacterized protein A4U43_C04F8380 [Asparagus officinalis]
MDQNYKCRIHQQKKSRSWGILHVRSPQLCPRHPLRITSPSGLELLDTRSGSRRRAALNSSTSALLNFTALLDFAALDILSAASPSALLQLLNAALLDYALDIRSGHAA